MARSLNDFVAQIQPKIQDRTSGTVEVTDVRDSLNRGIRHLINDHGIYATKNRSVIDIFPSVYEYPAPSDFHDLITVYDRGTPIKFVKKTPSEFWLRLNQEDRMLGVDTVYGTRFLLVKHQGAGSSAVLHTCDSLTSNGTWAADTSGSDATNLTIDSVTKKEGAASLNFDFSVSQSGNDFAAISNSTLTAVNLSSMEDLGTLFMWVFMPSITNISSVLVRWGSDSSNYWEKSVTTQHTGQSFVVGWNRLGFAWSSATETSSPSASAIDFLYVRIVYSASQANATDFRIDDIRMELPQSMEFSYYSTSFVRDSDNTLQDVFDTSATPDGDDATILDDADDDFLYHYALAESLEIKENYGAADREMEKAKEALARMKERYMSERKREVVRYY